MAITLQFTNNSGLADGDVYIGFWGSVDATYNNGTSTIQPMSSGTYYTLAELSGGISIQSTSGRVYVCYNSALGSAEPAQTPTDPYFFQRYDKFELTISGSPYDCADLTSIDYWAIPMSLYTSLGGNPVDQRLGLLNSITAQQFFSDLLALTNPPVSGLTTPGGVDGLPLPALVPGCYQQFGTGPQPPNPTFFCRVLGPSSYGSITPPGIPVQPYNLLEDYLNWLSSTFGPGTGSGTVISGLGDGTIANIQGTFSGSNAGTGSAYQKQTYTAIASISGTGNSLAIELTGTGTVVGKFTMSYQLSDLLNPVGIYGVNANYTVNGTYVTVPPNDFYTQVGGDLLAGLNCGAVGSSVVVSSVSPNPVGSLSSNLWWTLPLSSLFSGLQTSNSYYNQYADILNQNSQAYNFGYSDRFSPSPLISLNSSSVDTLSVTLEPATVSLSGVKPDCPQAA